MINEFSGFCEDAFTTLLDVYQMKDWGMNWRAFIAQAMLEFATEAAKWYNEDVDEEDS